MNDTGTDLRSPAGPARAYLLLASLYTALPLAAYAVFAAAHGVPNGSLAAVAVAGPFLVASAVIAVLRKGPGSTAGLAASAAAFLGSCMAASKAADAPVLLFIGFASGIVLCVALLMRNVDDILPPKLLMAVAVAQILAFALIIG